jgi:Holliday junction resolvase RusA-like endonuclease
MIFELPEVLETIGFVIVGKAVAKQGSRSRVIPTAAGYFTQHYTPEDVSNWAAYVKLVASQYLREPLWDGPIRVNVLIERCRPKARKNDKYCTTAPDLDNIEKNLWDAFHGVIYTNDARIVDKHVSKIYSDVNQISVKMELLKS